MKRFILRTGKKSFALLMACVMLISCWVFVAPEKAEAATVNITYDVSVTWQKSDSGLANAWISVYFYPINDDGTIDTSTRTEWAVLPNDSQNNTSSHTLSSGTSYTGFPAQIVVTNSGDCNKKTISYSVKINGTTIQSTTTVNKGTQSVVGINNQNSGNSLDSYKPVIKSVGTSPSAISITVPNNGDSASATPATAPTFKDQYGQVYPGNIDSAYLGSTSGIGGTSVTKGTTNATVSANHTVFDNISNYSTATGTASTTLYIVRNGVAASCAVTLYSKAYTATYNKADGTTETASVYYKGTPPQPSTKSTTAVFKDDTQHSTGTTWSPATAQQMNSSVTSQTFTETYIKENHTWSDWTTTDSTCTADGSKYRMCTTSGCAYQQRETILKKGHDFSGAIVANGDGTHSWKCTRCDAIGYNGVEGGSVACSGGTATCEAKAVCSACNTAYGEMLAHDYNGGNVVQLAGKVHAYECIYGCGRTGVGSTTGATEACVPNGEASCEYASTCTICNDVYDSAIGHNFAPTADNIRPAEYGYHNYECSNGCGETGMIVDGVHQKGASEACSGGTATCIAAPICAVCENEYGDYDPDAHVWGEWQTITEATCVVEGESERTCTLCYETETRNDGLDINNHVNTELRDKVDGNCGYDGYTGDTWCLDCNTKIITGSVIPATNNHTEGTPATCISKAVCSVCSKEYGEMLAHDYTGGTIKQLDDCHAYNCTKGACGTYGIGTETGKTEDCYGGGESTCTTLPKCTVCGQEYGTLKPHEYVNEVATEEHLRSAATCTALVTYWKSCSCGKNSDTEYFTPEGATYEPHKFTVENKNEDHLKSAATCLANAFYYNDCSVCGVSAEGFGYENSTTEDIGTQLPHSYTGAYVSLNNGTHVQLCVNGCGAYDEALAVDCTDFDVVISKTPNCSETGIEDHTCKQCGYTYNVILNKDPDNHNFAGLIKYDGKDAGTHSYLCTYGCGQFGGAVACTYEETVTAPTCTEQGYTTHTCSVCSGAYTDTFVPALGHDWKAEPTTVEWDSSNVFATATYTCNRCNHTEDVIAYSTSADDGNATCETATNPVKGNVTYTVVFEFNGNTHTVTKTVTGQYAAHKFVNYDEEVRAASCTLNQIVRATCEYEGCTHTNDKEVPDSATGHSFADPVFVWTDDAENETNKNATASATATRTCTQCTDEPGRVVDVLGVQVTYEYSVAPTCEATGTRLYTATAIINDDEYSDTHTVTVKALGHDYGVPQFKWTVDTANETASVVVTRICANDASHVFTYADGDVEISVNHNVVPDCVNAGYDTYKATVDYNGNPYTSGNKRVDRAALGHTFGAPEINFTWTAAQEAYNKQTGTATAKQTCTVCTNLSGRVITVPQDNIEITYAYAEGQEALCERDGMRVYTVTATGENGLETTGTYNVFVPMFGHSYGDPEFIWTTDAEAETATVKAKRTCAHDSEHFIYVADDLVNATFTVTLEPKCEEQGEKTYIATAKADGKTFTSDPYIVYIKATGHNYGDLIPQLDPTCITLGEIAHYQCSACNLKFVDEDGEKVKKTDAELEIAMINHNYGAIIYIWKDYDECTATRTCQYGPCSKEDTIVMSGEAITNAVTTEPLCYAEGVRTYTATGTMEYGVTALSTKEEAIAKTPHTFNAEDYESNDDGTHTAVCDTCRDQKFPAYDTKTCKEAENAEWVITGEATCDGEGIKYLPCATCQYKIKVEKIPVLGHDFTKQVIDDEYLVSEANCTEKAIYKALCSRCDATGDVVFEYGEIAADEHDFTQKIADQAHLKTAATCMAQATYYYDCARCDAISDSATYVAGEVNLNAHSYDAEKTEANLTRPVYDEEKGEWVKGYYTFTCTINSDHEIIETVERADYNAYKDCMTTLEGYKANYDKLTDEAKVIVDEALALQSGGNAIAQNLIETEQVTVDAAAAALQAKIDELNALDAIYEVIGYTVTFDLADDRADVIIVVPEKTTAGEVKAQAPSLSTPKSKGNDKHEVYSFNWSSVPEVIEADITITETATTKDCYGGKANCKDKAVCTVCKTAYGELDLTAHTGGTATCNAKAVCTICGNPYGEIDPDAHSFAVQGDENYYVESYVPATCTANRKDISYCTACNTAKSDAEGDAFKLIEVPNTALGHDYALDKAAEPTKAGYHVEACSRCDSTREVKCTAGTAVTENSVAATCTKDGSYDKVTYCKECDREVTRKTTVVPATGHSFTNYNVITPATCKANEMRTATCNYCKTETNTIEIDNTQLSHKFTVYTAEKDADGNLTGKHTATCDLCGEAKDTANCSFNLAAREDVVPATCEADGSYTEVITCKVCDYVKKTPNKVIAKVPHSVTNHVKVEPTCTETGTIEYWSCSTCGKNFSDASCTTVATDLTIPATGHTETEIPAVEPTCTTDGKTAGTKCSVCNEVVVKPTVIPAKGHTFGAVTSNGNGTHGGTCTVCGVKQDAIKCYGGTATCQALAVCEGCGAAYGSKADHKFTNYVTVKEATCLEPAIEQATCDNCDKTNTRFSESALGHNIMNESYKAPTCSEAGHEAYEYCSRCDYTTIKVIPATGNHVDENKDGKCDTCGNDVSTGGGNIDSSKCSCMCHKSGFSKFIYSILRVFWKIFGTNKTCNCGAVHY